MLQFTGFIISNKALYVAPKVTKRLDNMHTRLHARLRYLLTFLKTDAIDAQIFRFQNFRMLEILLQDLQSSLRIWWEDVREQVHFWNRSMREPRPHHGEQGSLPWMKLEKWANVDYICRLAWGQKIVITAFFKILRVSVNHSLSRGDKTEEFAK